MKKEEKKEEKKKKKSSGAAVFLLIVIIIAALICFLRFGGSFGFGGGSGNGDAVPVMAETSASETEAVTSPEVSEIKYIDITVDGNGYIYNNRKYDIEDGEELIGEIKALEDVPTVKITDENASQKAYEALTKLLADNDISYIEVTGELISR